MKFVLFFIFLVLYYFTSFTKIPFGDCIGFVVDFKKEAWATDITATSHFLYTNLGVLLYKLFPSFPPGEIGRFISVSSSALCVSLVYVLLNHLSDKKNMAFWITVAFGLGFTFWRNATNLEVYTFNAVFVLLFYVFLIKSYHTGNKKYYWLMGTALGISFMSHIQNILLLPSLFVFGIFDYKKNRFHAFTGFLVALFFILFIYIFNYFQAVSADGVLMANSNWVSKTFEKSMAEYLLNIIKAFAYLIYNFWFLTYFIIVGIIKLHKKNFELSIILLSSILINLGFSTFYAVSDNYNYFIISYVVFYIYIFYGINETISSVVSSTVIKVLIVLFPLFYFLCFKIAPHTEIGKNFQAQKEYKGGLKYYLLPWMIDNVGILEFTIENRKQPERMYWMTAAARQYIKLMKGEYTIEEIKKH